MTFSGDSLALDVEAVRIDTGRVSATFEERGPLADVLAHDRTGGAAAVARRHRADRRCRAATPAARGVRVLRQGPAEPRRPATERSYLEKALALAPNFDRARLALAGVHADGGDWEGARTVALAVAGSSPLRRQALFEAALAEINLKRYDDAFGRLQALASQAPSPEVFNNLGVIQLRRPPTPQTGRATYFFNKAVELEPSADYDVQPRLRLLARAGQRGGPLLAAREPCGAIPRDGDAHFVLAASLEATGAATEAGARARAGPAPVGGIRRRRGPPQSGHHRPTESRTRAARFSGGRSRAARIPRWSPPSSASQREMATFHLDRGRRFYERERRPERAHRTAARHLSVAVPGRGAPADRAASTSGPAVRARRSTALQDRALERRDGRRPSALGEAYVQAKDPAAARKEAERALALSPGLTDATTLLQRWAQQPRQVPHRGVTLSRRCSPAAGLANKL